MSESSPNDCPNGAIVIEPIGWVRSPYQRRFGTPQQASAIDSEQEAILELDETRILPIALADLAGFDRIWVISYLHRGRTWAPTVHPPRGPRQRRSVFSTRSPDRPNPIGLSAVRLVRIEGCKLHVKGIDLLDGTPIVDIKPYVPYADAFADSKAGWIDTIPRDAPQVMRYDPAEREEK